MMKRSAVVLFVCVVILVIGLAAFSHADLITDIKEKKLEKNGEKYGTISIVNPIINITLANYSLSANSDLCSKDCYAEGMAYLLVKQKAFDNITFKQKSNLTLPLNYTLFVRDDKFKDWQIYDGKEKTGLVLWRIEASKPRGVDIDWVPMVFGNVSLNEWMWWRSWQDWNDDFEDASLNASLFDNSSAYYCYGGGSCSSSYNFANITEVPAIDGYVQLWNRNYAGSAGYVENSYTAIKTVQDFNDTLSYRINFTMQVNAGSSFQKRRFFLTNSTLYSTTNGLGALTDSTPGITIFDFGNSGSPLKQDYSLSLVYSSVDGSYNATLWNATTLLNSTRYTRNKLYVAFEQWVGGYGDVGGTINIYNFTVTTSSTAITVTPFFPGSGTVTGNVTNTFVANLSMINPADNVTNATLMVWNASGYLVNSTYLVFAGTNKNETASISVALPYGHYAWTYLGGGQGTTNVTAFGANYSLILNDTTLPAIVINSPKGTVGSRTLNINITIVDLGGASYCYFNITRGAGTEVANTAIPGCTNTTATVSGDASYVLNIWANDTNGNINTTSASFTVDTSTPSINTGGGGGGPVTIIGGTGNWTMATDANTGSYELRMAPGTSRTKDIVFVNQALTAVDLKLTTSEAGAKYLNLSKTSVTLPLIREISTKVPFTVIIPEGTPNGVYLVNIKAVDTEGHEGIISVSIKVDKNVSVVSKLLFLSKDLSGFQVPYLIIAPLIGAIVFAASYYGYLKKLSNGSGISLIIGVVVAGLALFII